MAGHWHGLIDWFDSNANRFVMVDLDDPDAEVDTIDPDDTYVRLWLSDFFLAKDKRWARSQVPMVQAQVDLEVSGGQPVTMTKVARPPEGMVGPGELLDYPLTPLLPYRGGTIQLTAGLSALKGPSSIKAAIDTLQQFSSLAGAPFALAAAIARTVAEGVDRLSEATDAEVVLGLHRSFVAPGGGGSVARPGYVVIVRSDRQDLAGRLVVTGSRLHLRDVEGTAPLEGYDFMVFRVEARRERPDWKVGELDELLTRTVHAIAFQADDAAELERATFALVLTTAELVDADRTRVIDRVQDRLRHARATVGRRGAAPTQAVTLDALMLAAMPGDLARLRAVPSLEDALSY